MFRESTPWPALKNPLAAAEDALARLDERVRSSPIAEGFVSRTHFQDACASLWLAGELVMLEDLVLHDARMDVRSPTHEVTRAQAVLRARRQIAAAAPDWALSPDGLEILRGAGDSGKGEGTRAGEGEDSADEAALKLPGDGGADPLAGELAALDRAIDRSAKILSRDVAWARGPRDPLIYDPDWAEGERLEAWRRAAAAAQAEPPLLAAAILWDAWERTPGLARRSARRGDAAGAPENPVASGMREFGAAAGPPREAPLLRPGDAARRLPGGDRSGRGGGDGRARPLAAGAPAPGGQAERPPLDLPGCPLW